MKKFEKWAETVPYTMRNPLYHWTHLELARVFGVYDLLNPSTARAIYDECTEKLQSEEYRGQELMKKFNVKVVCTTDDPADSLEYHKYINEHPFGVKVLPAWRPDKAMNIEKADYLDYLDGLGKRSNMPHYLALVLLAVSIGILFMDVTFGIVMLVCVLAFNNVSYFKVKGEIDPYIISFAYVFRL